MERACLKTLTLRRSTKSVSSLLTFSKGGPIGMSLSEKMPLTSVARMPYTQIIATSASIATVKKKKEKPVLEIISLRVSITFYIIFNQK